MVLGTELYHLGEYSLLAARPFLLLSFWKRFLFGSFVLLVWRHGLTALPRLSWNSVLLPHSFSQVLGFTRGTEWILYVCVCWGDRQTGTDEHTYKNTYGGQGMMSGVSLCLFLPYFSYLFYFLTFVYDKYSWFLLIKSSLRLFHQP